MITAQTRFETQKASQYMQQLCKHFAHKIKVSYDATDAQADLPPGPAIMRADETGLFIEVKGADVEGLNRAKYIIEDHLLRFAHRENPQALTWTQ